MIETQASIRDQRSYVDFAYRGKVFMSFDVSAVIEQLAARLFPKTFGRRIRG